MGRGKKKKREAIKFEMPSLGILNLKLCLDSE